MYKLEFMGLQPTATTQFFHDDEEEEIPEENDEVSELGTQKMPFSWNLNCFFNVFFTFFWNSWFFSLFIQNVIWIKIQVFFQARSRYCEAVDEECQHVTEWLKCFQNLQSKGHWIVRDMSSILPFKLIPPSRLWMIFSQFSCIIEWFSLNFPALFPYPTIP